MGKNFFQKIGKSLKHNKTLQFLSDPVKPFEKMVSDGYHDVKGAVSYGGKHLINDVDHLSTSFSMNLPLIIGGLVVVMVMATRK